MKLKNILSSFSRESADICSSPGQCGGGHQGPEERRSSPGLQSQRRHDGAPQSCPVQEPGRAHGKDTCSHPFTPAYMCVSGFLEAGVSLWAWQLPDHAWRSFLQHQQLHVSMRADLSLSGSMRRWSCWLFSWSEGWRKEEDRLQLSVLLPEERRQQNQFYFLISQWFPWINNFIVTVFCF